MQKNISNIIKFADYSNFFYQITINLEKVINCLMHVFHFKTRVAEFDSLSIVGTHCTFLIPI